MKILFKISIVLSLFSALLFTSGFSTSNDSVQFIKTNWVENSEGVIIVNSHKELLEYYNVNLKKFSLGPREKIASDSTIGFANAIEKYDEDRSDYEKIKRFHNLDTISTQTKQDVPTEWCKQADAVPLNYVLH